MMVVGIIMMMLVIALTDKTDDDGDKVSDDVGLFASDKRMQWWQGLR